VTIDEPNWTVEYSSEHGGYCVFAWTLAGRDFVCGPYSQQWQANMKKGQKAQEWRENAKRSAEDEK
jgi:hypothetical protein